METQSSTPTPTNTPVDNVATSNDGSGRVEVDATGGGLTFDELEQVLNDKKSKKATEPAPRAKSEKSDDESKSEKKEKSEKKSSEKDEDGEKPKVEEKPARKTHKAKYLENELDIDEDAVFQAKVNDKLENVTMKDLLSNYSGKTAWDKKFSEVHKMNQEAMARQTKLAETARKIRDIYEEQDPEIKMFRMAEVAGVDPIAFREKFFNGNISLLEKYYNMSEDERRADALAYEAKYHKHRADTMDARSKHEQAAKELDAKISDITARHNISESDFGNRYKQLVEHEDKMASQFSNYQKQNITPEFIAETIVKDRLWDAAASKLDSLKLEIPVEARNDRLMKLVTNAYQMGLSPQDVVETVDEVWGSKNARRIIQEKQKQAEEFRTGKKETSQVGPKKDEPMFFSDL